MPSSLQVGNEASRCGWASEAPEFPQARTIKIPWRIGRLDLCRHKIHKFVRARFPRRPWLDVISKIDVEEEDAKALAKNLVPLWINCNSRWLCSGILRLLCHRVHNRTIFPSCRELSYPEIDVHRPNTTVQLQSKDGSISRCASGGEDDLNLTLRWRDSMSFWSPFDHLLVQCSSGEFPLR